MQLVKFPNAKQRKNCDWQIAIFENVKICKNAAGKLPFLNRRKNATGKWHFLKIVSDVKKRKKSVKHVKHNSKLRKCNWQIGIFENVKKGKKSD
jgi:hypothetical protein